MDGSMAAKMQFWATMGHPCAPDFIAADFLRQHPEQAGCAASCAT